MMKNNLIKKICTVSCALIFLTQLSLPSATASASTYSPSSATKNTKPAIAAGNTSAALKDGLNTAVAAKNSTEGLSKELTASASPAISYDVTGSPTVGSIIYININVSSASNLYGAGVDFVYDTSLIEVQDVSTGNLFSSRKVEPTKCKKGNGQVCIATTLTGSDTPISGSGSIAIIKAKILKAGTINLKTTNSIDNLSLNGVTTSVKLADNNTDKIRYTFVDKSINTLNAPALSSEIVSSDIPTSMTPGQTYNCTVKIKNTGSQTWDDLVNTKLGLFDDISKLNVSSRINLTKVTNPGEIATFTFSIVAPSTSGNCTLSMQMIKEHTAWFGPKLSKSIIVAPALSSEIVSSDIPTSMTPGQTYNCTVKIKNTGSQTWDDLVNTKLGLFDDISKLNVSSRINLTKVTNPGEIATFTFSIVAPSTSGNYTLSIQMIKEHTAWFGTKLSKSIIVAPTLSSEIVSSDIPTSMTPGQTYNCTVKIKNTSSQAWDDLSNTKLGLFDDISKLNVSSRINLTKVTNPGEIATFTFSIVAPSTSGNYTLSMQMIKENDTWFGAKLSKSIIVAPALSSEIISSDIPTYMFPGQTYNCTIKIKNTGSQIWDDLVNTKLGLFDDISKLNVSSRINLTKVTNPGEIATFTFSIVAPSTSDNYTLSMQMIKEHTAWFGPKLSKSIIVAPALSSEIVSSDIPTSMTPGQTYNCTVKIRNTGSQTWDDLVNTKLGLFDDISKLNVSSRINLAKVTNPGEIATFTFSIVALSTSGNYTLSMQMIKEHTAWFGPKLSENINIK
ncbi:NBR1-Ig-like domain-containing protein [Clostridium sp. SHJSY1]|uniref:NBR1-Ig-like domain-containing protein n=1 Tax=Clostridium sp. SHJSY1 TaxID=2942483 RepID=UPI0028753CFB|nr:NBR1-Ig-like domain-containing protein [Clostridium sp. SHJSY1]MDS0526646.1 NBR1-Ig-like domain-containing protein [Clostridium sp. SHJSY1]